MIELQPKDEADKQNGGNHPWDLNDGSEAYLLLDNSGGEAREFEVSIGSTGIIWEKASHLAPDETRNISIRNLLASKSQDDYGRTLPPNLTSGSIQWFAGRLHGRGRLARVYANEGRARNFSCGGQYWVCGSTGWSGQSNLTVGGTSSVSVTPTMCTNIGGPGGTGGPVGGNCGGLTAGQQSGQMSYSWTAAPNNVVTIQGSISSQYATVVGSQSGSATVTGTIRDNYGCIASSSQNFTVSSPTDPDHLVVLSDVTGAMNKMCSNGTYPLQRAINYTIYNKAGSPLTASNAIRENVPTTTSTCNGSIVQTGNACFVNSFVDPEVINEFTDVLSAGCVAPSAPSPCGFTFSNQQWQWCEGDGVCKSIGTVGLDTVTNLGITLRGNTFSLPPGTVVNP